MHSKGCLIGVLKFLNSGWLKFYCLSNSNASSAYTNLCTVLTSDEKSILLNCLIFRRKFPLLRLLHFLSDLKSTIFIRYYGILYVNVFRAYSPSQPYLISHDSFIKNTSPQPPSSQPSWRR